MAAILQTSFWNSFLASKLLYFYSNLTDMCSNVKPTLNFDSDTGLAPSRLQAIIRPNGGIVYRHIYAPLGLKELSIMSCNTGGWTTTHFTDHMWRVPQFCSYRPRSPFRLGGKLQVGYDLQGVGEETLCNGNRSWNQAVGLSHCGHMATQI